MKKLRFRQIDVFTAVPFRGNPVAVVFDADGIPDDLMQSIANWTNLSETTFVQSSERADYRLRIFTPGAELPFAGHPTIGSAYAALQAGIVDSSKATIVQDCHAGLVPITIGKDGILSARVPACKVRDTRFAGNSIAAALGVSGSLEALHIEAGAAWIVSRVDSRDILYDLSPDEKLLVELSRSTGSSGFSVYAVDDDNIVHVRSFAPAVGVFEDPVCGSGNAAVAAHIRATGVVERLGSRYIAHQGAALGRDGHVHVTIDGDDIYIGGQSVGVIDGSIQL